MLPKQIQGLLLQRLAIGPNPAYLILVFFTYSFLGYIMECIVVSLEKRKLVINRGFTNHLPLCIIYGFGALAGFVILSPFKDHHVLLFIIGSTFATGFEYIVGRMQIKIYGDFWWDYTNKPFNYKSMLCLESSLGWGILALVVIGFAHEKIVYVISKLPANIAELAAFALLLLYFIDFIVSSRQARKIQRQRNAEQITEIEEAYINK